MKKYESYKESGIEEIQNIPSNWTISRIKYICQIFGRIGYRGYTVEDIVDEEDGVITISPSNIKNDNFNLDTVTYLSFEKYYESPEIMIFPNDIILVKTGSTIGKTAIIPNGVSEMTINPQLIVLKDIKINPRYFYYQTTCPFIKESFFVEQTGSTTPTISQEKIEGFPILIPQTSEQSQIVEYLDHKISLIDDLLAKKQKKIELLKEKRIALINQVVTKGLNPNVEMKDSGVEWIGEIPNHWSIIKGRYILKILTGNYPNEIIELDDGDYFVKVDDLNKVVDNYYLDTPKNKIDNKTLSPLESDILLFPKRGAAIFTNKVVITKFKCFIDPNLMGIKVLSNFNKKYLFHLISNKGLGDICDASTIPQINNKHIYPLELPNPSIEEQQQIVEYIDKQTNLIDSNIDKEIKKIDLLKEYRQSLISAVVTGKIDVSKN